MLERSDLEPVFAAPFVSSVMKVEPEWIDYNGHLHMAYHNVLFAALWTKLTNGWAAASPI